ncbi:MAG: glycosyl hydrolase 108 family protein [Pseudolabrys sp.]
MAKQSYDEALRRLLAHEGGYTNHPADPGGPTNFGITIHDYRRYVKPGATAADVKAMTVSEAKRIYRAKYWDAQRCDELPAGVDYAVFDYGVNSGIGRSKKVLQRVVGVKADGVLGPLTMCAVNASDPKAVVIAICDERLRFLKRLRTWPVFGRGWGRRVAEVKAVALAFAANASVPATSDRIASGKGALAKPTNKAAAAAGAIAAAGAAAAQRAHAGGFSIDVIVLIAAVAIIAAVAVVLLWSRHHAKAQEAPA